jgi:hypothetical protein
MEFAPYVDISNNTIHHYIRLYVGKTWGFYMSSFAFILFFLIQSCGTVTVLNTYTITQVTE